MMEHEKKTEHLKKTGHVKTIEHIKAIEHLKTISRHKKLVFDNCIKAGLYKQAIFHDLSKFTPAEFILGVKYYEGDQSPHVDERKETGYSKAWLNHKAKNKHHLEYWMDYSQDRTKGIVGVPMPKQYIIEMFCDRVAASKNYNGENYNDLLPLEYYMKSRAKNYLYKDAKKTLEKYLYMLATKGEDYTFRYIKNKEVIPLRREKLKNIFKVVKEGF